MSKLLKIVILKNLRSFTFSRDSKNGKTRKMLLLLIHPAYLQASRVGSAYQERSADDVVSLRAPASILVRALPNINQNHRRRLLPANKNMSTEINFEII